MTYLQLVNQVLQRLREDEVGTVNSNNYSKLIGTFVNSTLRDVENSWNWNALNRVSTITTVAGQAEYSLSGTVEGYSVNWIFEGNPPMKLKSISPMEYYKRTATSSRPVDYTIYGVDASNNDKLLLYPTPDNTYGLTVSLNVKSPILVNDTDIVKVPNLPVILGAWARAVGERGEDGGVSRAEAQGLYENALRDAIALEDGRYPLNTTWTVI